LAADSIPAEGLALARSRAYALFADLFRQGLSPRSLPQVMAIPELASPLTRAGDFDPDRAAADHYALFGFNVFPYESVFLDREVSLGGSVGGRVRLYYHQVGYAPPWTGVAPDHIALELGALAHLCGAEADAWADDLTAIAARMQALQRRFLDEHLLRWALALVQAIRGEGFPFFTALGELTVELLVTHRRDLGESLDHSAKDFSLPAPPIRLDDPRTGLKEVASYLLTPAGSGLYLSRKEIGRLARAQSLPCGFGDRQPMLTDLLRAAVDHDQLDSLAQALQGHVACWQAMYRKWESSSYLSAIARTWIERLEATRKSLARLEQAAAKQSSPSPGGSAQSG
jgi:TorA maturation chaperone TorD